jgi:hypothetical protein
MVVVHQGSDYAYCADYSATTLHVSVGRLVYFINNLLLRETMNKLMLGAPKPEMVDRLLLIHDPTSTHKGNIRAADG